MRNHLPTVHNAHLSSDFQDEHMHDAQIISKRVLTRLPTCGIIGDDEASINNESEDTK